MPAPPSDLARPAAPSFWQALAYWLKLGFISFGGPAGQIALMHQELVDKRRWISEGRFLHALNYCMLLPGPEAQQLAIYLGWLLHRTAGGIVAGVLFVLPSFFVLAALSYIYLVHGQQPLIQAAFAGIKPVVVAIVAFTAWRIGSRTLQNRLLQAIAALALLAMLVLDIAFPSIVAAAALTGIVAGRLRPAWFQAGTHAASRASHPPALIDDDTPRAPHTQFRWAYLAALLTAAGALWAGGLWLLDTRVLHDMGTFFTRAALLTFGGAYAVLPYVYQGAVENFQWLSAGQMIDGLALGETTPGPLIMIVAFVGFIGAWGHALFGPDALLLAGLAGAATATFFTFLPSFVFILAGAPLVESTHGDLRFTAPLTAISAAVVGVIVNLALFFAEHVFWPQATSSTPFAGPIDLFAILLAAAAFVGLKRYQQSIIRIIGAGAALGLLRLGIGA